MSSIFMCQQCDYKIMHKGSLLRHIKSKHKGIKFPCEQCDYKATRKGDLLRQRNLIHEYIMFPQK